MELERALTKLKFDESVTGYALITNDGSPFLSFQLPEDVFPQIAATLRTYSSTLRMMNVMTGSGIVVLARVDANWVLAVLFNEPQLGIALQKTKGVITLLEEVSLPRPPQGTTVTSAEPGVSPEIETTPVVPQTPAETPAPSAAAPAPTVEAAAKPVVLQDIPLESIVIRHGCVVLRGPKYAEAMMMDSEVTIQLKAIGSSLVTDALLMVDDKRTVFKISQELAKSVEDVTKALRWCVSKQVVTLECPEEQAPATREIVDYPLFEGDLTKAKKEHRAVLERCNGSATLQEIAADLGIQYFQALQAILPYKGKTLKLVRKDSRT